ncbi:MAG: acetolactate synthase small subunit [Clostridia bacterium]|nr:acetolactate synthase small subunit [Clostridia bacterium]
MNKYTLAVLVGNQFGVLNRVTSMFRRRQFNISALTVSETESNEYSRITIIFAGDEIKKKQLVDQLYKLPDVYSIKELNDTNSISCELMLVKMKNDPATRSELKAAAEAYEAKLVDYSKDSVIYQIMGSSRKMDEFINLMRDHQILEICRTGNVSLEIGGSTIRQTINL